MTAPHLAMGPQLAIGKVTRPHGVRGELTVRLYWAESTALGEVTELTLAPDEGAPWRATVERVRPTPRGHLLKLLGVDDLTAAERWRGAEVRVERAALPPLDPGEYYLADLVGLRVTGPSGELGVVVETRPYATTDTIVVEDGAGRRREHPLLEPWLVRVDVSGGIVELSGDDGFLD